MDFAGRVVIITGASSGIGAACAAKFAEQLAQLALVGRNEANLRSTAQRCRQLSQLPPLEIVADVSKEPDVERIVKQTIDHFGRLDVLVNNAGVSTFTGIHGGLTTFDNIMSINLRGPYQLSYLAIPHLKVTKGCIVNMSSVLSTKPNTSMMPYCMSKAALDMMTKCLALELAASGVRVNAVNPGPVRTEIFKRSGLTAAANESLLESMAAALPLQKVAGGEDIAELVLFLSSGKASFVTGSCYVIDGGVLLGENVTFNKTDTM